MTLMDDIKSALTNDSASLSNTLRKAKILATTMRLSEFREWVDYELGGYPKQSEVPAYRVLRTQSVGQFSGPFGSGASNVILPTSNLPSELRDLVDTLTMRQGVGQLEALHTDDVAHRWPSELVTLARPLMKMSDGMELIDARRPISSSAISGILDQVKNKLLDFLLSLEENHITVESMSSTKSDTARARNLFNVNIYGSGNIVASGENVHQHSTSVKAGDLGSLLNFLNDLGISDDAVTELQDALSEDGPPKDDGLGPRVRAWVGGVAESAAMGTIGAGSQLAVSKIASAILAYYGLAG